MRYLMVLLAAVLMGFGGVHVFVDHDYTGAPFAIVGVLLFVYALTAKRLR